MLPLRPLIVIEDLMGIGRHVLNTSEQDLFPIAFRHRNCSRLPRRGGGITNTGSIKHTKPVKNTTLNKKGGSIALKPK